ASRRQRSAALEYDPQVRSDRMDEAGFGRGDATDVHVVLAALDHAKRLELLRIHVLQVLRELVLGNGDRVVLRCLLENDCPSFAALSAAPSSRCPGLAPALRERD